MVPRTAVLLATTALALLISTASAAAAPLHVLLHDGRTVVRQEPDLPPPDPIPLAPRVAPAPVAHAAQAKTTFARAVNAMFAAGQIDALVHEEAAQAASDLRSLLRKLPAGARRNNVRDALNVGDRLASAGQLTPARVPVITQILSRNAEYWNDGSLLAYGARVSFEGSRIVWQYYPGVALQPQWQGTFGFANSKALSKSLKKSVTTDTTETLDEALTLATPRAGGISWESFFSFSGAPPVWVSSITQGTAISAYSHAAAKLGRPDYMDVATQALGIFQTPPPEGVALSQPDGVHYLIYSTNPKLLVLNTFLQALTGLFDYAQLSGNPLGLQLFQQGDSEAQAEIPRYDTGAWSLYEGTKESSLSYHQLVTGFLQNLCDRTQTPIYCDTATRFTADETTAPTLKILTNKGKVGASVPISFQLSKESTVSLYVNDVPIRSALLPYGKQTLSWAGQSKAGKVTIRLKAKDLAGNVGETSRVITLSKKG